MVWLLPDQIVGILEHLLHILKLNAQAKVLNAAKQFLDNLSIEAARVRAGRLSRDGW